MFYFCHIVVVNLVLVVLVYAGWHKEQAMHPLYDVKFVSKRASSTILRFIRFFSPFFFIMVCINPCRRREEMNFSGPTVEE